MVGYLCGGQPEAEETKRAEISEKIRENIKLHGDGTEQEKESE
ncbi:MAG: hypothetical protein ACXW6T_00345 [Candidatus Binatia bacterium]